MISNITPNQNNLNINNNNKFSRKNNHQPAFKGGVVADIVNKGANASFSWMESSPIIAPLFVDLVSMVIPRTIIDFSRGEEAGIETFRREISSSYNLFLFPGVYALGTGAFVNAFLNESKKAPNIMIDNASAEALSNAWKDAGGETKKYAKNILRNIMGIDGVGDKPWKKIPEDQIDRLAKRFADVLDGKPGVRMKDFSDDVVKVLGAERGIRFYENINTTLGNLANNAAKMKNKVFSGKSFDQIDSLIKNMKPLNNKKIICGIGIAAGIGAFTQYFNRILTKQKTGTDAFVGLPGYENMKDIDKVEEKENKNTLGLWAGKIAASALMAYWVGWSLAKNKNPVKIVEFFSKPKQVLKSLEFNNALPTMNQMKALMGITYIGRFLAAYDDNELKESAVRDNLGFLNLLVIGSLVSTGTAFALAKKKNLNLSHVFNGTKLPDEIKLPKEGFFKKLTQGFKKLNHVLENFTKKTHREIDALKIDENVKNQVKGVSNISETVGLLYSALALGLFTPIFNKYMTNKAVQAKSKEASFGKTETDKQNKPEDFQQNKFNENLRLIELTIGKIKKPAEQQITKPIVNEEFLRRQFLEAN